MEIKKIDFNVIPKEDFTICEYHDEKIELLKEKYNELILEVEKIKSVPEIQKVLSLKEYINIDDNAQGIKTELPPLKECINCNYFGRYDNKKQCEKCKNYSNFEPIQKPKQRNMTKEESEEYEKILESQYKKTGNKMFDEEKQDKLEELNEYLNDNECKIMAYTDAHTFIKGMKPLIRETISSLQQQLKEKEEEINYLNDYVCYLLGAYTDNEFKELVESKYINKKGYKLKNNKIKVDDIDKIINEAFINYSRYRLF